VEQVVVGDDVTSYDPSLWTYRYAEGEDVAPYGDDTTYRDGLGWLYETCDTVEDWGAGAAYGRRFVPLGKGYLAIDGSAESAPFVDHVCDLKAWRPADPPDGIFIRHVLEHDLAWHEILFRALSVFTKRLALVVFTPFEDGPTRPLRPEGDCRYDLAFNMGDLTGMMLPFRWSVDSYLDRPALQYGQEHLFRVERA
jgi:hypothetical protein